MPICGSRFDADFTFNFFKLKYSYLSDSIDISIFTISFSIHNSFSKTHSILHNGSKNFLKLSYIWQSQYFFFYTNSLDTQTMHFTQNSLCTKKNKYFTDFLRTWHSWVSVTRSSKLVKQVNMNAFILCTIDIKNILLRYTITISTWSIITCPLPRCDRNWNITKNCTKKIGHTEPNILRWPQKKNVQKQEVCCITCVCVRIKGVSRVLSMWPSPCREVQVVKRVRPRSWSPVYGTYLRKQLNNRNGGWRAVWRRSKLAV